MRAAVTGAAALCGVALVLQNLRDHGALVLQPQRQRVPDPPAQAAWISPLRRQCHSGDPSLRQRLLTLQQTLPQRLERLRINPSNYAERLSRDAYGNPLDTTPSLVVLHETVYGLGSAINTFTTHHPQDADQVSYHLLIGEQGRVVETLDPSKRAFGAGYSAFRGRWVITNPAMAGSVNNFALHLSLETPLMRRYRIPFDAITTHRHVDLGLERADPRSFDWAALQRRLAALGALC